MISRLIAKRLKPIIPSIISLEQTSFVEGRQILDGLIVSQEVVHSLESKKMDGAMIKLDLSKAYNRLSLVYLRKVLETFGFYSRWIE